MTSYKHTQFSYLITSITLIVILFFVWIQITARSETPSINSGTNFAITAIMVLIVFILASFVILTVSIDEKNIQIQFGYGVFKKKFPLKEIVSVRKVKNHWYYGWGIRFYLWPRMWIYNVSGFDAIEITMNNHKIYRIGTDEPDKLEDVVKKVININFHEK